MDVIGFFRRKCKTYDDTVNFTCDICRREVFAGERICKDCRGSLPYNRGHVCPFCGRRVREPGACLECKFKPPGVEKARSVCVHSDEAARLVIRFKRGESYLYRTLADEMYPLLEREFPTVQMLIGVPMTEKSRKKRGYNQSELLAARLAELSGKTFLTPVEKRRDTDNQRVLGRLDREKNLEGCFHVHQRKEVKGKRILIVDDTMTTGATISELARVLRGAGAASVEALTFTSVENKYPFGKPPAPPDKERGTRKAKKTE